MTRLHVLGYAVAALVVGCNLLAPYPGGEDPARVIEQGLPGGESPLVGGDARDPLVDPTFDPSLSVTSNRNPTLAIPGEAFPIDLNFTAQHSNVIGGGIQFPGVNEIQWTFIESLRGLPGGKIQFGYVVDQSVCADLPKLCHEIQTQQFAVAENVAPDGDVDGDGERDEQFVVSEPAEVTVVLRCASCEATSCQELLPPGECRVCSQPAACQAYYERCLAPGRPNEGTDEANLFGQFLGPGGVLWSTVEGCIQGTGLCEKAEEDAVSMPDVCGL